MGNPILLPTTSGIIFRLRRRSERDADLYAPGIRQRKCIELQAANVRKRIAQSGGKLYLEFGCLFDDYHASRVLPGFEPDTKFRMLESLVDDVEIVIAINANHIEKARPAATSVSPTTRTLRTHRRVPFRGFLVGSVVLTQYANQPAADAYRHRLGGNSASPAACITRSPDTARHRTHRFQTTDTARTSTSRTTRPLVVVTAPGPGSGKLATCLEPDSTTEHQRGIDARLCQIRTFPIWNLPLNHPVSIA